MVSLPFSNRRSILPALAATALLIPLLAPPAATAAEIAEFEITPSVGFRFLGEFEDRLTTEKADIEESPSFGLALDIGYAPDEWVQVFYSRQSTDIQDVTPGLDLDVEYFQIGGVAEFPMEGDLLIPYAVGTIGAARFSPSGGLDDETGFALTLGGGWKYYFNDRFALRFEGRGYLTFFDNDTDIFCLSDQGAATCRLRTSGSLVWQLEAQAGVTFRF